MGPMSSKETVGIWTESEEEEKTEGGEGMSSDFKRCRWERWAYRHEKDDR